MNETQCRICLQYIECLFKLDDKVKERRIWEALNSIANVSVALGDLFPQWICWSCFDKLDQAIQFQREVERSDAILHHNDIECITVKEELSDFDEKGILEPIIKIESNKTKYIKKDQEENVSPDIHVEVKNEIKVQPVKAKKRKRKSRAKSNQTLVQETTKYCCCICHTQIFNDETELIQHIESSHQSEVQSNLERKYTTKHRQKCKYCKEKFRLTGSLVEHRENPEFKEPPRNRHNEYINRKNTKEKLNEEPIICEICGKILSTKTALTRHEQAMHATEFPFECPHPGCGKKFAGEALLTKHKRIHREKKHICDVCGKGFLSKKYLDGHVGVHQEIKRYHCAHCPRTYSYKNILLRHILLHFEDKIHRCGQCDKTYKWESDLKAHINGAHLGNHPFKCKYCSKGYFCSSSRKYHQDRCTFGRMNLLMNETQ